MLKGVDNLKDIEGHLHKPGMLKSIYNLDNVEVYLHKPGILKGSIIWKMLRATSINQVC